MLEVTSFAFTAFDQTELKAIRAVSRLDRSFEGLVRSAVRVQFMRASLGSSLGFRAEKGMALIEAFLLFMLAAHPAGDADELRIKALLFRCGAGLGLDDNSDAMLCAAIELDGLRLGASTPKETSQNSCLCN